MARLVGLTLLLLCCWPAVAAALPPANVTPPVIDDTSPAVGDTLHAGGDLWDDAVATVVYQWRRCDADGATCADITDAIGATYTVVPADAGSRLQVRSTATNADGSASSDSAFTDPVPDVPPQNATPPSITGIAQSGQTLTAEDGTWSGTSPTVTRQWLRCDGSGGACEAIPGATGQTLLLGGADERHTIRVRETASNGGGQASADSDPTAPIPARVTNVTPPVLTGSPVVGSPLISSIGTWAGTPPFLITRRWQRCPGDEGTCTDIPGRVSDFYFVEPADVGSRIRVVVRASNEGGASSAASALSAPVTAASAGGPQPASPSPATTALAGSFDGRPRRAGLARALERRLKIRGRCTGPCRIAVRLTVSGTVARKWRVPRTIAVGRRALAAAGTVVVRPRFAKATRLHLRRTRKLAVTVTAQARDGAGKLAGLRRWKLTLTR